MTGGRSGTWIRYAVVWMLAAAGVYGLTAMEARRENALRSVRRTTYSAAPGGYKALYLWWKEMGIPVLFARREKELMAELDRRPFEVPILFLDDILDAQP